VVAVLGPKWRIHYYAHLEEGRTRAWHWINRGEWLGSVGTSGNAAGKPPHLHYAVITQLPYPWRYRPERFGFERMFYLDPGERLLRSGR
jgi:murein DD-endopeptidase MepM/ murein hydrolase activator NlpD